LTEHLLVMARLPELGRVKTRLAASVGPQRALEVYRELAGHTLAVAEECARTRDVRVTVLLDGDVARAPAEFGRDAVFAAQSDGDLGDRLRAGLDTAFEADAQRACAIGTDCPGLTVARLGQAFDALAGSDAVIGPASDGGYYLIGFREPVWQAARGPAFDDVPWSSARTRDVTVSGLLAAGLSAFHLDELDDVDTVKDLERWRRRHDDQTTNGDGRE